MGAFARRPSGRSATFSGRRDVLYCATGGRSIRPPGASRTTNKKDFAMNARIASAPARPGDGSFAVAAGAIALCAALSTAVLTGAPAFAQAPPAQPAPKAPAQPKAQPKAPPQQAPAPAPAAAGAPEVPPLT